ncbi:MAG: ATP synthase F0 subunit B [Candidatus Aminicenantes bacterium]|nr:ATP synthase F0 subunit B [Candidatus Aminicenantes bacterium]
MLSIDASLIVVFVLVWILVLVLSRVFFKPVIRVMRERETRIAKDKDETRQALEAYAEDLRRIEEGLKEARLEAARIRESAAEGSQREKARLLQEVNAERRAQVDKARAELQAEVERLKKELEARTDDLAGEVERRLLN